jgi:hypothetical protein
LWYGICSNPGLIDSDVNVNMLTTPNPSAYLVINQLLIFVVLVQHGEELNDIRVLGNCGFSRVSSFSEWRHTHLH